MSNLNLQNTCYTILPKAKPPMLLLKVNFTGILLSIKHIHTDTESIFTHTDTAYSHTHPDTKEHIHTHTQSRFTHKDTDSTLKHTETMHTDKSA